MRSLAAFLIFAATGTAQSALDYPRLADHIVSALKLRKGERVLLRNDPGYFHELVAPLRNRIAKVGAVALDPVRNVGAKMLENLDVCIWLPIGQNGPQQTKAEEALLETWLNKGGLHREIHFHWSGGSVLADGLPTEHPPAFDALYQDGLDIDYKALSAEQDRAIGMLRTGVVRVSTKQGTDLRFRVGSRPFNKQDGDASPDRMKTAIVRVDREIELPAGVLRVAPLEDTAEGTIFVPSARFGQAVATNVKFSIERGKVVRIEADSHLEAVEAALEAGGAAALQFREFGLGFNPKLKPLLNNPILPYFGYGIGVVRLSLGDNTELGGNVRGNFRRWFFFPETTVEVDGRVVVKAASVHRSGGRSVCRHDFEIVASE